MNLASTFHSTTLARPVSGLIGPDADTYLALLDMQGLAPASHYEYHRELTRLAEMYPDLNVCQLSKLHLERYLVHRSRVAGHLSPSTVRRIMACVSGFFSWAASSGLTEPNPTDAPAMARVPSGLLEGRHP